MGFLLKVMNTLTLQMLHDASETVTVGSNQHPLSLLDLWNDLFIPEWQCPSDGVFEALAGGELVLGQVGVTAILEAAANVTKGTHCDKHLPFAVISPCLWSHRNHGPHPWLGVGCQKSASRS